MFGYDDTRFGAHAEYLTIGEDAAITTMPDGMDFRVMAPATEGSHYALAYIRAAGVDHSAEVSSTARPAPSVRRPCRSSRASALR